MIDRPGPFASVYFDSSHDTEDADRQFELNQRTIREKLSAAGASTDVIGAIGIAVAAGPPTAGRSGRALIADCRTVLVDEQLPAPPPRDLVRVSPLPCILPLLEQRAPRVPHVVALLHPAGARLYAMDRHGDPLTWSVDPVNPLRDCRGQRPTRRHTRDRMHRRIEEVADQVFRLADRVAAVLLILIGDGPSRAALHNALDARYTGDRTGDAPETARRIIEIDGADRESLRDLVRKTVAEAAEDHYRLIFERYRAERDRPWGATTSGLAETTAALRERFVAQLLIDGAAVEDHQVLVGESHTEIATTAKELTGQPELRRADEALPAAALAGNSEIIPINGRMTLPDGVGALLRAV